MFLVRDMNTHGSYWDIDSRLQNIQWIHELLEDIEYSTQHKNAY